MLHLLALEWDQREIRLAVASGRGRQVVVDEAFAVACGPESADARQIGRQIAAALDARGLGRPEAVVMVGRASIELRQLQLPPAPDSDLPDMVRFQAAREFNELDDKWLLDFVPIEGSATSPRSVLAMAIAPAVLRQIEAVCEEAGLKMRRLLLRPCEAASLLAVDAAAPSGEVVLLVDPLGGEADLTAVAEGAAVFLRSARFSSDPPPLQPLLAEIRLTMAAASNQLGGRRFQSILLCGSSSAHQDLARQIEAELGLAAGLFDPFDKVTLGRKLIAASPEHPGRFAPLLGALTTELRQSPHPIDFLHPRRRAVPPDLRKKWAVAGAVAAVLLLGWFIYGRVGHDLLASSVNDLQQKARQLDAEIADAKKELANTADLARWADAEFIWLDQIHELNESCLPAKDMVLGQLHVGANQQDGRMKLKGWVRDSDSMVKFGERVRARGGTLNVESTLPDSSRPRYKLSFEATYLPKKNAER